MKQVRLSQCGIPTRKGPRFLYGHAILVKGVVLSETS